MAATPYDFQNPEDFKKLLREVRNDQFVQFTLKMQGTDQHTISFTICA